MVNQPSGVFSNATTAAAAPQLLGSHGQTSIEKTVKWLVGYIEILFNSQKQMGY
jgi:hypothetical protein